MTLVGGGELFTGNTALVTAAVIEKKAEMKKPRFGGAASSELGCIHAAVIAPAR